MPRLVEVMAALSRMASQSVGFDAPSAMTSVRVEPRACRKDWKLSQRPTRFDLATLVDFLAIMTLSTQSLLNMATLVRPRSDSLVDPAPLRDPFNHAGDKTKSARDHSVSHEQRSVGSATFPQNLGCQSWTGTNEATLTPSSKPQALHRVSCVSRPQRMGITSRMPVLRPGQGCTEIGMCKASR